MPKERFLEFIKSSQAYETEKEKFDLIWEEINFEVYEFNNPFKIIEMIDSNGLSSYYSSNITKKEA